MLLGNVNFFGWKQDTVLCKRNESEFRENTLIVLANFRRHFERNFVSRSVKFRRYGGENSQTLSKFRRRSVRFYEISKERISK